MSAWSCACAPAAEVPQFTLPVLCDVPSSVLRWFQQVLLTISSLPMLSSQHLQGARQPRVPRQSRTNGVSSRSCNVRFMLRPARSACPALVRTFTSELSQVGSPPKPASDITSWLIVYYHSRIFPGRTGSLMGCGGDWTICRLDFSANFGANCVGSVFCLQRFSQCRAATVVFCARDLGGLSGQPELDALVQRSAVRSRTGQQAVSASRQSGHESEPELC